MLFEDTYKTIDNSSEGIFRDRGSKFMGYAYPINTENEVKEILSKIKSEHPKARHYCWALRLSLDTSVFRLNDDGEPTGSAGRPILNTLLSSELTNILVVVVRYFGGTLLGIPGLINAYKSATLAALASANIIPKTVNDIYFLEFDYLQMNDVMRIVKDEHLSISKQTFETNCSLEINIRKTQVNKIIAKLDQIPHLKTTYIHTL
jgi:uncharacterized YigZ family protein